MASSIKCSLSLQQRQLSYNPILICLEGLLPAVSYWLCCMMMCSGCFPSSFTLPQTVFFWHSCGLGQVLCDPPHQTPRGQLVCERNFSAPWRSPKSQSDYAPSNLNETAIFAAQTYSICALKVDCFLRATLLLLPPKESTLGDWNRLICSWRWRGPAVDHWLVKTLSLHSCELSIKNDATQPCVT